MRMLIWMGSALLAFVATAQAQPNCSLTNTSRCLYSYQLMGAKGTVEAIRDFLKNQPGNILTSPPPKTSALDDVLAVLDGGVSSPSKALTGGRIFISGCQAHNCTQDGAMIVDATGKILAIGILHDDCSKRPSPSNCQDETLVIFTRVSASEMVKSIMGDWARGDVAMQAKGWASGHKPVLTAIQVRPIAD